MARSSARAPSAMVLLGLLACGQTPAGQTPASSTQPADLVLTGAVVHTMDPARPRAQAIAIRQGRIVHVGSDRTAQAFIGPKTRHEALHGRTILPGLHDSHTHLIWSGTELQDASLFEARNVDQVLAAIVAHAARWPDAPCVRGSGWQPASLEGKLSRVLLDRIVRDRPVYMASDDGHSAWVNSAALAAAGITAQTPDPPGGRIERDARGEPTGILRETATSLVSERLPPYSAAQVDAGLTQAMAEASSHGITSIVEASATPWMVEGYERAARRGTLSLRVHLALRADPAQGARQLDAFAALRARHASPLVRVSAVKLFLDGVIESQTAYMVEPYLDGTNGTPRYTDAALAEAAIAFDRAGFQLHAHVIGDGAVRQMLDALERVSAANGAADRRPLLAHVEVVHEQDLARLGARGVLAVFSPLWAHADPAITELTVPKIGPERAQWLYPMAAVQTAGGVLVAGSDWNVSSMDPFDAMEVAVTRQEPERSQGEPLAPRQRVGLADILAAYTIHGARASFVDHELGSVTEGKRADLIVIDRDPFAIEAHELSEIQVLETLFDGRVVYRARPALTRPGAPGMP